MAETTRSRSLLNLYEVKVDGVRRHVVCLLDPVLAGARGIDARAIVGGYSPGPSGGFDPRTFQPNPAFIEAFTRFMNDEAAHAPEVVREALARRSRWLHIIDSRHPNDPDIDPPPGDIIGCFTIDDTGQIVPNSFQVPTPNTSGSTPPPAPLAFSPTAGSTAGCTSRPDPDQPHAACTSMGLPTPPSRI